MGPPVEYNVEENKSEVTFELKLHIMHKKFQMLTIVMNRCIETNGAPGVIGLPWEPYWMLAVILACKYAVQEPPAKCSEPLSPGAQTLVAAAQTFDT